MNGRGEPRRDLTATLGRIKCLVATRSRYSQRVGPRGRRWCPERVWEWAAQLSEARTALAGGLACRHVWGAWGCSLALLTVLILPCPHISTALKGSQGHTPGPRWVLSDFC